MDKPHVTGDKMRGPRALCGLGLIVALSCPITISNATTGHIRLKPNDACADGGCKAWVNEVCQGRLHLFNMAP